MKIDCCMITTNLSSRLNLMEKCVDALKKHDDKFAQKIMSVDIILYTDFYFETK
jgi:hypothetical protein